MAHNVIATDNFNRVDNTSLGSSWTIPTIFNLSPQIVSNAVKMNTTTDDNLAYWNANSFAIDQYSQATINDGGTFTGVVCRCTSSDYIVGQQNTTTDLIITWYNGGAYTAIGTTYTTSGWNVGDVALLEADMYFLRLYQNGTLRVSAQNTSIPLTGSPGIDLVGSTAILDDWSGGNIYPIGIIARAASGATGGANSVTLALTIPTGYSNIHLQVLTQCRDATDADRNITGITWNTSETLGQHKEQDNVTYDLTVEQWGLANPSTGTHNVVVSFAGVVDVASVIALALCDVAQTGQPDASNGATNTGNPSVSVTSTVADCMIFDSVYTKDNNITMDTSQILIAAYLVNASGDAIGVSREYKATAGAVAMDWTIVNAVEQHVTAGVSIKPFVAAVVSTLQRAYMSTNPFFWGQ